jgi:hypothetical protein
VYNFYSCYLGQKKSPTIFLFIYYRKPTFFGKTQACGKKDAYEWPFKKQSYGDKWLFVEITLRCLVARSPRKVYTLQQEKTGLSKYCHTSWKKI